MALRFSGCEDVQASECVLEAIEAATHLLAMTPYSCRKATKSDPVLLREMLIPYGSAGYVALFEVEPPSTVAILAVRHQREDDYR